MPVYTLCCNDCGHEFRSLVLAGTRRPQRWDCSHCGGANAEPKADAPVTAHPWEQPSDHERPVYGCMCCF